MNMIILKPVNHGQNVYFIKRPFVTNASNISQLIQVTDDITGEDLTYGVGTASEGDFTRLSLNVSGLKEGRFYTFKVWDKPSTGGINAKNNLVYKDKIFCTDQRISQTTNENYSINEDVYTSEEVEDNDYIVI